LRILAIETSGSFASLGVVEDASILAERTYLARKRICSTLANEILQLLAIAGLKPTDLGAVAVSRGPGSFTGLRVGVATANALAQALRLPVVGLPTLEVVAASSWLPPGTLLLAASPSKRTELYVQTWRNLPPWRAEGLPAAVQLAHLRRYIEEGGLPFLAGEAASTWLAQAGSPECLPVEVAPRPSTLAALALKALASASPSSLLAAHYVLPIYCRASQPEEKTSGPTG